MVLLIAAPQLRDSPPACSLDRRPILASSTPRRHGSRIRGHDQAARLVAREPDRYRRGRRASRRRSVVADRLSSKVLDLLVARVSSLGRSLLGLSDRQVGWTRPYSASVVGRWLVNPVEVADRDRLFNQCGHRIVDRPYCFVSSQRRIFWTVARDQFQPAKTCSWHASALRVGVHGCR